MDAESQFALAHTCTMLYNYHKHQCKEQSFTLLCNSRFRTCISSEYIKALERYMSQTGWMGLKITLNMARLNAQNSYEYPVKALYLYEVVNLPNGLDCTSVNALMIDYYFEEALSQRNISFLGKFSNLTSLKLRSFIINDDTVSMVSKLSLLGFIFLYKCSMTNGRLSKLFEGRTTLEEIQLLSCYFSDMTPIKLPSQVKRFKMKNDSSFELDASDCTQLSDL